MGGGLVGSSFHSCQDGLSWDQTPIRGGAQKRLSEPLYLGSPPPHHVEASGGFWSWLPLGIHSQKPGPPPSGGAEKLQATTVCYIRTGCWYRPWTPQSTSEHLGTG